METIQIVWSNAAFDEDIFVYNPELSDEKQIYWLRKEIIRAHRAVEVHGEKKYSTADANQIANRNVGRIFENAKKPVVETEISTIIEPEGGFENPI